jgi:hypothetical protein
MAQIFRVNSGPGSSNVRLVQQEGDWFALFAENLMHEISGVPGAELFQQIGAMGLLQRNRIGDCPHAEFVALQSRFEVANGGVEQVLGGFVEQADMLPHGISPMKRRPVWRNAESSPGASASALDGPEFALRRLFGRGGTSIMDI